MFLKRTLLAALPLAFSLAASVHAATTLKVAEIHPAGYPTVVAMENMAKKLQEATNGEITYRMFAGGVLGSEKEVVEQTQLGAVQLTRVSLGSVGPVVPDTNVFNMPFVFRDVDHMRKVIDGEIGQEILDKITNSQFNMVGLAWMEAGSRSIYTKKPVRKIEDLKGMKIRVIGNPLFIDTLNAMGANGVAMSTGEIFSALQTGVIDGAENNSPTLLEHNHYQVAKYYTQTHHLILPEPLMMSKTTWESLTPEQQQLVKKFAREAQMEERKLWEEKEKASDEKLKAAGVEYIEVDTKPFYDATAPVREKYGAPYADLIKRIEAVK
ncbi:TRAP transporter substrate-binding protein [Pseudomonas sp. Marseille-QA0892]